ncbi:hypothetical protein V6N11_050769 [Hibiscus sabdariffa]|uniref:Uncharacterized protein n=1 Tax=Hibiscus sabdariffa TaxID=183260 RepID=A0ABR2TBL0_9ROSI
MEKLSHMGFHPDVEDVQLNLKLDPKDSFVHAKERERLTLRSSEEVRDLAINSLWEDVESGSRKTKDPWAKAIDENFNEGFSNVFGDNVSRPLLENHSDGESGRAFFSEMEPIRLNKRGIKGKRYSSLDLQDKKIIATERKKRDKAMRRQILDKKNLDWLELSGRSLLDSDLLARWDIQIKEARKSLKLGKKMQIFVTSRPFVGDFKTGLHRGLQKRTFDCVSGCVGSTVFGRG